MSDVDDLLARLYAQITRDLFQRIGAGLDIDGVLARRDDPAFDEAWVESDMRLSALNKAPAATQEATILAIRSAAYLRAFDATSSSDFAGYVSDDFELIANSIAAGSDDPFVAFLLNEYLDGRFPAVSPTAPAAPPMAERLTAE